MHIDGFSYGGDTDTGMRRSAANTQIIECGAVDVVTVTTTGASVAGTLDAATVKQAGFALIPVGLGPLPWSGTSAPSGWVLANGSNLVRASYPALWTFAQAEIALGNTLWTNGNGTTTFGVPDLRGRVPGGDDNMGGGAGVGRLTAATMTPDGQTLGATSSNTSQTVTLVTANLPAYTPAGSVSVDSTGADNILSGAHAGDVSLQGGATAVLNGIVQASLSVNNITSTGVLTGTPQGGTSTPVVNVQPTIIVNYIVYAGA